MPAVVVHPERVERRRDDGGVAVVDVLEAGDRLERRQHVVGIRAPKDGIEEQAVALAVDLAGHGDVLGAVGRRVDGVEVERDAVLVVGLGGAHRRHREAVPEQQVVGGVDRRRLVVAPGAWCPVA